jgi:hypothetical protein
MDKDIGISIVAKVVAMTDLVEEAHPNHQGLLDYWAAGIQYWGIAAEMDLE